MSDVHGMVRFRPERSCLGPEQEGNIMAKGDVDTYHEGDSWKNKIEGNSRASGVFDTKAEAVAAGRDRARADGVEHVVKKLDGTIGGKNSYGEDKFPPRG